MIESLLGEFPLYGWRTDSLTCLSMEVTAKRGYYKTIDIILDEDSDTMSKESRVIIYIDAIPEVSKPSKY